jgi:O-palmitoleoyl-L-serine hydrolase
LKGKHNRDETVKMLLEMGMKNASHIVISGCSAGALAVYLGLDDIAALIHRANPQAFVRGLALSGFFAKYSSLEFAANNAAYRGRDDGIVDDRLDYAGALRKVYDMANMSAGINRNCVNYLESDCVFAENVAKFLRTAVFSLQPQYDSWQLLHILGKHFNESGANMLGKLVANKLYSSMFIDHSKQEKNSESFSDAERSFTLTQQHGAFIDSCSHHCFGCSTQGEDTWNGHKIVDTFQGRIGISPAKAFDEWYTWTLTGKPPAAAENYRPFYWQNASYPCSHCCQCSVSPLSKPS